jgi:hypothetical protein
MAFGAHAKAHSADHAAPTQPAKHSAKSPSIMRPGTMSHGYIRQRFTRSSPHRPKVSQNRSFCLFGKFRIAPAGLGFTSVCSRLTNGAVRIEINSKLAHHSLLSRCNAIPQEAAVSMVGAGFYQLLSSQVEQALIDGLLRLAGQTDQLVS